MFSEEPISRRLIKEIGQLDAVKWRRRSGLFVAEGTKCVMDLSESYKCRYLFATSEWIERNNSCLARFADSVIYTCGAGQLGELTRLSNTPPVIAAYEIPASAPEFPDPSNELVVVLDGVQDPGNLGTIIRTSDWMGVKTIVASVDTVDAFNPKTVQSTMGALSRVNVIYTDLSDWLNGVISPIYGTFLNGENIYKADLSAYGVIIMGNEGHGISNDVTRYVNRRLFIPSFPPECPTSESLNVATATAITLSEFRSRYFRNNG